MGSLNGCPPPFQQDASGAATASTLQTGDVNNASAQAQPFLPRRRFNSSFAPSSSNSPFPSLSLSLPRSSRFPSFSRSRTCNCASLARERRADHRLAAFSATTLTFIKSSAQWPACKIRAFETFVRVWKCRSDVTVRGPEKVMRLIKGGEMSLEYTPRVNTNARSRIRA